MTMDNLPGVASNDDLVAQYIIEEQNGSPFLSFEDYNVIRFWLAKAKSVDELLLALHDFFEARREKDIKTKISLKKIEKFILKKL